jgi:hypothetical protein
MIEMYDDTGKSKKNVEANMYCSVNNHIVGEPWSMDLGRKFELVIACLPPILRVNLA